MADLRQIFPDGFRVSDHQPKRTYPDPFNGFLQALNDADYEVTGQITPTAETPVRCRVNGSKDKPGWYHFKLFRTHDGGEIGYGHYSDWRDGVIHHWSSANDCDIDPQDVENLRSERKRQEVAARDRLLADQYEAAKRARAFVAKAVPAVDHPYLTDKGVLPHGILACDGSLVVTMHDSAGNVGSYQTIQPDGVKRYMKGGQKNGLYHLIGKPEKRVFIAEGFATGATVHELTGDAVVVAFDTSGLKPALNELRKVYAGPVVFAADNDPSGAGEKYARDAAEGDSLASVIVARFSAGTGTDFNDLAAIDRADAKKQLQVTSAMQRLRSLSVTRHLEEMKANLKNEQFIVPGMALSGQTTIFIARPNGGKTLFMLRWLSDLINGGGIDPGRIFYINADDNYRGTHDKGVIAKQLGFEMISPAVSGMTGEDVLGIVKEAAAAGEADGMVLVLDTIKKFTDLMSKTSNSALFKTFRELNAKNITVILLGHANKHTDEDGKLIYEGTADVVNDSDCVYYMNRQSPKDDEVQTVEFVNEKDRGSVRMKATYTYEKRPGLSYVGMMESITELNNDDAQQLADKRERQQLLDQYASVTLFMKAQLKDGPKNQSELFKAKTTDPLGKEFSLAELKAALKLFDGDIWETSRNKKNNALTYALKGTAAKDYLRGSQGE